MLEEAPHVTTFGHIALGACLPFLAWCLYTLVREVPEAIRTIAYERKHGIPVNRTTLRRWVWWLFVRPGFQLGPLYEDKHGRVGKPRS